MQPDRRMAPGDDQYDQLERTEPGRPNRIDPQDEGVTVDAGAEKITREAGIDDVAQKQQRDREAEHHLRRFRRAQPEAAALP